MHVSTAQRPNARRVLAARLVPFLLGLILCLGVAFSPTPHSCADMAMFPAHGNVADCAVPDVVAAPDVAVPDEVAVPAVDAVPDDVGVTDVVDAETPPGMVDGDGSPASGFVVKYPDAPRPGRPVEEPDLVVHVTGGAAVPPDDVDMRSGVVVPVWEGEFFGRRRVSRGGSGFGAISLTDRGIAAGVGEGVWGSGDPHAAMDTAMDIGAQGLVGRPPGVTGHVHLRLEF